MSWSIIRAKRTEMVERLLNDGRCFSERYVWSYLTWKQSAVELTEPEPKEIDMDQPVGRAA